MARHRAGEDPEAGAAPAMAIEELAPASVVVADMESRIDVLGLATAALTLACVKTPDLPDPKKVVAVHPLSDDGALVIGDDFVATVAASGSIRERRPLAASCWKLPWSSEVRCPIAEHDDTIVVVGTPFSGQAGAPRRVPVLAVDRSTLRSRWSQEVPLEASEAFAAAPVAPAEGHCLVHDTRARGREDGVVVDLACESGVLRWRRVFPDVSVIYRSRTSPRAVLIGRSTRLSRGRSAPSLADECAAHEARFLDLADGSSLARVPADPWFHCLVDDRLITVTDDDLVAYDLNSPGRAGEVLIAGFGERVFYPTPSRFDCHRQGRSLAFRVDFTVGGLQFFWLLVLDPEGGIHQYHAPPGDQPLVYPEGAELPPFIVFPSERGSGDSEPDAIDLRSGHRLFVKEVDPPEGIYAMKRYYPSGSLLAGEFPPVGVGPSGVFRYDPETLAPDGVRFAHAGSLLGVTEGVIWTSREGTWPPWHRIDRHDLAPLDGAPADLLPTDADPEVDTYVMRQVFEVDRLKMFESTPSQSPAGPDPRCDHPPTALERARLASPNSKLGSPRPAAPFRAAPPRGR